MPLSPSSPSQRRVLLISPPYRFSQGSFPFGPMYVAAALQKANFHVEVIDMDVLGLSEWDYVRELRERRYDFLCMGGMITAWNFLVFSACAVKQLRPDVKIIVGGGIISSTPKSFLSVAPADVGIIGEGEDTILDLIDAFENKRSLDTVNGIVYRSGRKLVITKPRAYITDPDRISFPAWDLFNAKDTYCSFPSHNGIFKAKRSGNIFTARGCPFQCTFCYTEKTVRFRSVENIIAEIKELKERYNIGYLTISDDLFIVRKPRVIEFCEAIVREKLNLKWTASGRCNMIDRDFLKICKEAGCDFMGLGIESGSPDVLKAIKKNQTPEQVIEAVRALREVGITPGGTFIIGLPSETTETIGKTVELYKRINQYRDQTNQFFFATPYPGTELYNHVRTAGKIKDEIEFFEKLSISGDAVDFCINCSDFMSDEELVRAKRAAEGEVFKDFKQKHPWLAVCRIFSERTGWSKISNLLIVLKLKGLRGFCDFLKKKILIKSGLKKDSQRRWWNEKKNY